MSFTDMTSKWLSFFKSSGAVITLNWKFEHLHRRIDKDISWHLKRLWFLRGTGHCFFINFIFRGFLLHVNIWFWFLTKVMDWNLTVQLRLLLWSSSLLEWRFRRQRY
jgi:hypothetical protein